MRNFPRWIKLLSEASDHRSPNPPPSFFAAPNVMVITSPGLLPLFIYLYRNAVINPWWQTCSPVSSPKTPCLMKYICLINTYLSSAAFPVLWQRGSPPGRESFRDTREPFSRVFMLQVHAPSCCDSNTNIFNWQAWDYSALDVWRCRHAVINGKLSNSEPELLCG